MADQPNGRRGARRRRIIVAAAAATAAALALPALATAHIERPAYWPDPRPDHHVQPAAGGNVPEARSLASAFDRSRPGKTLVVCKRNSMTQVARSIHAVRTRGYALRPTLKPHKLSAERAHRMRSLNRRFAKRCGYRSIQKAVFEARNNDF